MQPQKRSPSHYPPRPSSQFFLLNFKPSFQSALKCNSSSFTEKQMGNKILISKAELTKKIEMELQKKLKIKNQEILNNLYLFTSKKEESRKNSREISQHSVGGDQEKEKEKGNSKKLRIRLSKQWKPSNHLTECINSKASLLNKTSIKQQPQQCYLHSKPKPTQQFHLPHQIIPPLPKNQNQQKKQTILTRYASLLQQKKQIILEEQLNEKDKYIDTVVNHRKQQLEKKNWKSFSIIQQIKENQSIKQKQQMNKFNRRIEKFQKFIINKQKYLAQNSKKIYHSIQHTKYKYDNISNKIKIAKNDIKRHKTQSLCQQQNQGILNKFNRQILSKQEHNQMNQQIQTIDITLNPEKYEANNHKNIRKKNKIKVIELKKIGKIFQKCKKLVDKSHHAKRSI